MNGLDSARAWALRTPFLVVQGAFFNRFFCYFSPTYYKLLLKMSKRTVTLCARQFAWLCSKLQQEYSSAHDVVNDMTSPSTYSYFKRNEAEDVWKRHLQSARDMISFCESFRDTLLDEKGDRS